MILENGVKNVNNISAHETVNANNINFKLHVSITCFLDRHMTHNFDKNVPEI